MASDSPSDVVIAPASVEEQCDDIIYPSRINFLDKDGTKHSVFIDLGDHDRAYKLTAEENWDELKKYPKYGRHPFSSEPFYYQIDS